MKRFHTARKRCEFTNDLEGINGEIKTYRCFAPASYIVKSPMYEFDRELADYRGRSHYHEKMCEFHALSLKERISDIRIYRFRKGER